MLRFVCANPALDMSGHVPAIRLNEKNYVTRERRDPGGNAINSARIAKRLGASLALTGFAGGEAGDAVLELLREENLRPDFVRIGGETRTNVTVTNDQDHNQTRLTFPGPRISAREKKALIAKLNRAAKTDILVFGGSRPHGTEQFYPTLLAACKAGALVADLPGKDMQAVFKHPRIQLLMIKPNLDELETLTGKKLSSLPAIAKAAVTLTSRAALVCVSLGKDGALAAIGNRCWLISAPKVKARGSVGAGDSLVGAAVWHLERSQLTHAKSIAAHPDEALTALRWGVAAGCATAQAEGTQLGRAAEIRRLFKRTRLSEFKA